MKMTQTIDLAPTWTDLIPVLVRCIENGGPSRDMALEELTRLAGIADAQVAEMKASVERTRLHRDTIANILNLREHTLEMREDWEEDSAEAAYWCKVLDEADDLIANPTIGTLRKSTHAADSLAEMIASGMVSDDDRPTMVEELKLAGFKFEG